MAPRTARVQLPIDSRVPSRRRSRSSQDDQLQDTLLKQEAEQEEKLGLKSTAAAKLASSSSRSAFPCKDICFKEVTVQTHSGIFTNPKAEKKSEETDECSFISEVGNPRDKEGLPTSELIDELRRWPEDVKTAYPEVAPLALFREAVTRPAPKPPAGSSPESLITKTNATRIRLLFVYHNVLDVGRGHHFPNWLTEPITALRKENFTLDVCC
jgi:hypothetical protein